MSESDHRDLASMLRGAKASVVLSGYASDLYDNDLFPDWHRTELKAGTGQNAGAWANRTEVLWSNKAFSSISPVIRDGGIYSGRQLSFFGDDG
jgi:DNA adenine methylase